MHRVRLFAGFLVLAAVVMAAWTIVEVEGSSRAAIQRHVTETREAWETLQADRYKTLRHGLRVLANDPALKAGIVSDEQTVFDMLDEKGRDLRADFVLATNASGHLLARTDRPGDHSGDPSSDPMLAKSGQGEESASVWKEGDKLFHAVSVPMRTGPELMGTLVAGYGINQGFANDLGKITHSQVAFFVAVPGAAPRLSVSSLGPKEAALTASVRPASSTSEPFEIDLEGEPQIGIQVPLAAAGGQAVGSVIFLRNLAEERAHLGHLRTGVLVASVVVIALSLAVYFAAARSDR